MVRGGARRVRGEWREIRKKVLLLPSQIPRKKQKGESQIYLDNLIYI